MNNTAVIEGGSMLTDGLKSYSDLQSNAPNSVEAAAALLNLAGIAFGLLQKIQGPFMQGLSTGIGVNAGALGVVLGGIQLGQAIDRYREALAKRDGQEMHDAKENLADKTCGVVAGIGAAISAVPGLQPIGFSIWLGATAAQQITNGNAGRLIDFLGKFFSSFEWTSISYSTHTGWAGGLNWRWPSDPLALDLDGDGVELTDSNAVLFDLNSDGIRTSTQWIGSDDGLLVRDLNANNTIDSGRELFGDQTQLSNGSLAANGFAALSDLDANADGVIDGADTAYAELRIWRDLNQDGVSQAEELQSLADLGISSVSLAANAQGQSTYTRTVTAEDGSISTMVDTVQNVNFQTNNFYREFTDDPEITTAAAALPQMQGAGLVRDLREAMSLGTTQSSALERSLNAFKAASGAQERQSLLDQVINAWADTSSQADAKTRNAITTGGWYNATVGDAMAAYAQAKPAEYAIMTVLERFNAQPALERYVRQRSAAYYEPSEQRWKGYTYYVVEIEAPRLALFSQAYQALKSSAYKSLYLQTTGQDLLGLVEWTVDEKGLRLDFAAVDIVFASEAAHDPASAVVDLAEFIYFAKNSLHGSDWDGAAQLADLLETTPLDATQNAILTGFNYKFAGAIGSTTDSNLGGSYGADVIVGRAGNDKLDAGSGDDILIGGQGDDQLIGGYGNDQLIGGQGNDYMNGQWGTDTYFWGVGQGNDYIQDGLINVGEQNTVVLRGLNPADVSVELVTPEDFTHFKLTILSSGETLTLDTNGWNYYEGHTVAPVRLVFADGSQWGFEEIIRQTLPMPTDGDDFLMGSHVDDRPERLNGGAGDDIIVGREGSDVIEGGTGNDTLYGHAMPWYYDADGHLTSTVQSWRYDVEVFADSDVYVFGRGDGQDTITDRDYGDNEDVLRFKEGVSGADLELMQRGNDLVAMIKGTSDQVTIKDFYVRDSYWYWHSQSVSPNAIERFDFADGTQWLLSDINRAAWAGTARDDVFVGDSGDNAMSGADGNDSLDGGNGDDVLSGGDGSDILLGNGGDDILDGGAGNDQLYAGYGADVIRFGRGDGRDVLARDSVWSQYYRNATSGQSINPDGNNVVELKAGISTSDVKLVRDGTTLNIRIKGTDDVLTIKDFYVTNYGNLQTPDDVNFSLREIRFEDGTSWDPQEILAQTLIGDESNETFKGYWGSDVFDGRGGSDRFYGEGGLDTYLFGRGDGTDHASGSSNTLILKEGVDPADVVVRRVGTTAVFTIRDTGDSITFDYAFPTWTAGIANMTAVKFADGTIWNADQINQKALEGTSGDDVISDLRLPGEVTLAGGAGNDTLMGGRSDQTVYVFNRGDGQDTIDESGGYSTQDTLRFGPGIVASDLVVRMQGQDLVIGIAGTDDKVTIKSQEWAVEKFDVGGVILNRDQILNLVPNWGEEYLYGSTGDDVLVGTGKTSHIEGYDGNDTLSGDGGIDYITGGNGDDVLAGGSERDNLDGGLGSNTYVYQRGDGLDRVTLSPGANDHIQLGEGFSAADVTVQMGGDGYWDGNQYVSQATMVIGFGGNDALLLKVPAANGFVSAIDANSFLRFADGSVLSYAALMDMSDAGRVGGGWADGSQQTLRGSQADDDLTVDGGSENYVEGRDNNDQLTAYSRQALLDGGDGSDYLSASYGGALLAGAKGDDQINSYSYFDANTIAFNLGDGKDRVEGSNVGGVLSFGVGIDPSMLRFRVDRSGDLIIQIAGSDGDEIRTLWYQDDQGSPITERAFDKLQFIDSDGKTRLFDLTQMDVQFDRVELLKEGESEGLDVLAQAPEMEILTPTALYGGKAAIAYAQTGYMLGDAYVAGNLDPTGDNIIFGTPGVDALSAGDGNDRVMAGDNDDTVAGEAGNDYLDGQDGNDVLLGGDGDDVVVGGYGEDVLDAGTGRNQAFGGADDDTYLYARGNGYLYIDDGREGNDPSGEMEFQFGDDYNRLEFGAGISIEDLTFERDGDNLKVTVAGVAGDTIVLAGFDENLENRNRSVDEFIFQDGTSVNLQDVWSEDSGNYLAQKGDGDLIGTDMQDDLQGGLGGDFLEGGRGDDRLQGGAGDDAYLLGHDSGNDVIVDWAGEDNVILVDDNTVTEDDIYLITEGGTTSLVIGNRHITLEGWDGQDISESPISKILLANGGGMDMQDLHNRSRSIIGTPQVDVLQGGAGVDVIWGLQGNDLMQGGAGADTYVIEAGSGADTITDTYVPGEENAILFLDGTEPEDIRLTLDQDRNLVLQWRDGSQVTLTEDFDYLDPNEPSSIVYFQFGATGPVLSYQELLQRGFEIDGTSQNDVLYTTGQHDVVNAGDGDDVILGSSGGDNLNGGGGNDLYEYRLVDGWVGITDVADAAGGNVVRFGEGITPEMLERKLRFNYYPDEPEENSLRIVFDEDNVLQLNGFDPLSPEGSPHAVEYFEFADGTVLSWDQLLDKVFVVEGYDEASFGDVLTGTSRSDRLYGYAGDDELHAGAGNDVLTGGQGIDVLAGGDGEDNYVFQLGDGVDVIQEAGTSVNTITFGEGVFEADISVQRDGADLVVHYGTLGDSIRIASADGVTTPRDVIQHIELADGTLLSFARFVNVAPVVGQALENQEAQAGTDFSYAISGNAFSDLDGDVLELRARLGDGQPLPEWLEFDAATGSFNGMPPAGSAGIYDVVVYAVDPSGDAVQQTFQIAVSEVQNGLPTAIADSGTVDEELEVTASGNVLANDLDPDATDVLTVSNPGTYQGQYGVLVLNPDGSYVYTLDTGSAAVQALAEGASVNEAFSYVVSDGSASDQAELTITIAGRNDLPVVTASVPNQSATEEAAWSYILPLGLFSDIDVGDVLSLEVRLANGDPLPSWLSFDPQSLTLAGTPANSDVGSLQLQVSATDQSGAVVSTQFALTVSNVNDAPQVLVNVPNQSVTAHYAFNYQIPTGAFGDEDAGDSLTYAVTLATGGALPAWLQFDPTSRMLTGKPVQADVGVLELQVVATDSQGVSASQVFQLSVSPLPIIWGTEYNDILDAYTTGAIVYGLGGNDILYGEVGNDVFYGGDGNDKLYAWDGDDLLDGGNGDDILTGDIGNDVLLGGTGNDDLFGYAGDDILYGQDGNDYFEGNAGADVLYGGLGDDTYLIEDASDQVIELSGEGNDTIESHISLTLGDHVEHLTLMGSDSIHAIGNALDNELTGNSAANTLLGHAGIDYLYGNGGDDILDGGEGADGMYGGAGNDTYYVDDASDWVQEGSNQGTDTVISTVTRNLNANFENLTLVGTASINGTGNGLANILIGNDAVNSLSGGGGSDTLDGRGGNDTLTGGAGSDTYLIGRGYGTDTVVENDSTSGNTDVAQFLAGVSADQIWFRQTGNNLEASIIGTSDALIMKNWYLGSQYQVEQFQTADGQLLLSSQVQNLVQAMAQFSPPASGETTLPSSYQADLQPVIAANWQ